ncbi:MAG: helix-turn-helix domain-containing protein [Marinomonas sp.]|uniref:helix-turn-helix domain-containing protein n=1 Tax=Marinomonas sp. TaxID=1904862 RepID=UPI003C749FF5
MVSLMDEQGFSLADLMGKKLTLQKGDCVFCQGQMFDSVYLIGAGSLKTYNLNSTGKEGVTGFYFQGDIVGFSGMDMGYHPCFAKVLEPTQVYKILFHEMEDLSALEPFWARQVLQIMSRQIRENQRLIALLGSRSERKIASFLLGLSAKFNAEVSSAEFFKLTMSRNDIAAYLGVSGETVSRTLTQFHKKGYIQVKGKEVSILSFSALQQLNI